MAVQTWEDILASAQLSAEERRLIDNTLQKVPALKEGWLRQDDYSRKMTDLSKQRTETEALKGEYERWVAWADEKVPIWEKLVEKGAVDDNGNLLWPTEKERLEADLKLAREQALAGGDMDPKELERRIQEVVRANGGVTREEYAALAASEAKKMATEAVESKYKEFETGFNERTIPFVAGFSTAMAVQAARYEKETGKEFTAEVQKEYFDLMAKEKNFDPYAIGKKYLEPIVSKKTTEAEIERLANERAEKIIRDRGGLPGTGGEGYIPQDGGQGSLQKMLEMSKEAGSMDVETRLDQAVTQAAKEMRMAGVR